MACNLGTCAAAGWMTHAAVTSRPPQVFELDPGMGSGSIWQEVSLLRRCNHKRIVPLLGVAIKVRRRRFPCSAGLKGGLCAAAMACLLVCLPACLPFEGRSSEPCHASWRHGWPELRCSAACWQCSSIQLIWLLPLPPCLPAEPAVAGSNGIHAWWLPASRAAAARAALGSQVGGCLAKLSCPALPCTASRHPSQSLACLSSTPPLPAIPTKSRVHATAVAGGVRWRLTLRRRWTTCTLSCRCCTAT